MGAYMVYSFLENVKVKNSKCSLPNNKISPTLINLCFKIKSLFQGSIKSHDLLRWLLFLKLNEEGWTKKN